MPRIPPFLVVINNKESTSRKPKFKKCSTWEIVPIALNHSFGDSEIINVASTNTLRRGEVQLLSTIVTGGMQRRPLWMASSHILNTGHWVCMPCLAACHLLRERPCISAGGVHLLLGVSEHEPGILGHGSDRVAHVVLALESVAWLARGT